MALKPCRVLFVLSFLTCLQSHLLAQAPNNTCANATTLTVSGDCTPIQGDLFNASSTNVGCGNRRDVWYRFVLPSNSTLVTVTITPIAPTNINPNNVYVEMFNTRNCTLSGTAFGGCQNITQSRTYTGLMPDSVYYFRIQYHTEYLKRSELVEIQCLSYFKRYHFKCHHYSAWQYC